MLLAALAFAASSELSFDPAAVDAVFRAYDRDDGPGCAVGVIHEGELVYARGFGMANLEHGVPLAPNSVLRIGSVSKQFTAACAVLAEQQGLLALDDDVREHVPELPEFEEPLTIRQMLHHTSGIRDYLGLFSMAGYSNEEWYGDDDVTAMLARQRGLNFEPGTGHLYSNSGYFLISVIVERASGKTLSEFAEEHLFGPLGMTDTHFHDDHQRVVPRRVDGYTMGPGGKWLTFNTTLPMCGDGGVFTTVEDLVKWDSNFYEPKVGGEAFLEAMLTRGVLDDGTVLDYALGLTRTTHKGLELVAHGGAFVGFRADMFRYPSERTSIICLGNIDAIDPTSLCREVANVVLADRFPGPGEPARVATPAAAPKRTVKTPATIALEPGELARFAGRYIEHVRGSRLTIDVAEGGLRLDALGRSAVLAPTAATEFHGASGDDVLSLTFEANEAGGPPRGVARVNDQRLPFSLDIPWDGKAMSVDELVGEYYAPELDATWTLSKSFAGLSVRIEGTQVGVATPLALDLFGANGLMLAFERDAFQAVAGFRLNAGRVQGLVFEKR